MTKMELVHRIKEVLMLLKYYRPSLKPIEERAIISRYDGRRYAGGLVDRLNGMISMYALAKAIGVPYKSLFIHPFNLSDYLHPASYDWVADEKRVSNSIWNVRIRTLWGEKNPRRVLSVLNGKYQYHTYSNRNYIEWINNRFGCNYTWSALFNELFKPSPELQRAVDFHKKRIGGEYICCTFRFQSLLGDFKEYDFPTLPKEEQELLILKNREALLSKLRESGKKVLVTSDSATFLAALEGIENVYTLPGELVHMDCTSSEGGKPKERGDAFMKPFLDFYMISGASASYCIGTKEMFTASNFPMYAAMLNNIPFERIIL